MTPQSNHWQKITPENQPKAPCVLLYIRASFRNAVAVLTDDRLTEQLKDTWTHFMPIKLPQPEKHPVEVAFEEWWKQKDYTAQPGNWTTSLLLSLSSNAFKAGAQWAFSHAAENRSEKISGMELMIRGCAGGGEVNCPV